MKYAMTNIQMDAEIELHDSVSICLKAKTEDEIDNITRVTVTALFVKVMGHRVDVLPWSHDFGEFVDPDLDQLIDDTIMPWAKSVVADAVGPVAGGFLGYTQYPEKRKPDFESLLQQIEEEKAKRDLKYNEDMCCSYTGNNPYPADDEDDDKGKYW